MGGTFGDQTKMKDEENGKVITVFLPYYLMYRKHRVKKVTFTMKTLSRSNNVHSHQINREKVTTYHKTTYIHGVK